MQRATFNPALNNCRVQNEVQKLAGNVFNLNVNDMELVTRALGLFTGQNTRKEFEESMTALRRIHGLVTVALDRIIDGYTKEVLPDLAQAYIITEYQYRRGVINKPCLIGLIEHLLNDLSDRINKGDRQIKDYARRVRLVMDAALVAAKRG